MARRVRTWRYHWWDPASGIGFGVVAGWIARDAGWSLSVAVGAGIVVGVLGATVIALAVWVDTREASDMSPGWPERLLGRFTTFGQTYGRINRRLLHATTLLLIVMLVWIGLTR